MTSAEELVILLDEDGRAAGTAPKRTVHHRATPLHLAFSCYVFDAERRLLLTQRALHKRTFPGVWTNSCCGHPAPGERLLAAVRRRVGQELGLDLHDLQLVLPGFRYEAVMENGVRENELCPVFTALTSGPVQPDPAEVAGTEWVAWTDFRDDVLAGRQEVSLWCVQQVAELATVETEPAQFASASPADLPPAARPD